MKKLIVSVILIIQLSLATAVFADNSTAPAHPIIDDECWLFDLSFLALEPGPTMQPTELPQSALVYEDPRISGSWDQDYPRPLLYCAVV